MGTIAILFLLTFTLQYVNAAKDQELAQSADEPSHVVSAVMIHDYIAAGMPAPPMKYAEAYYARYPKVAIGHWPPLLYVVGAFWMLVLGVSRHSLLLLSGTITTILAVLLANWVRRMYGPLLGLLAGAAFIALHSTQSKSDAFMLDMGVALASFAAALLMERFFRQDNRRTAIWMGLAVSAAMLVKGNGMALILMVGLMLLATRRWDMLRRPYLYLAGLVVILVGFPWQLLTIRLLSRSQIVNHPGPAIFLQNLQHYSEVLLREFTLPVAILAAIGLVLGFWRARDEERCDTLPVLSMACLFSATVLFHSIVPIVDVVDSRYMTAALPPGIALFLAGCDWLARLLPRGRLSPAARMSILAVVALVTAAGLGAFRPVGRQVLGFSRAADLAINANGSCCTMLICSDATGEGAFISEMAFRDRDINRVVLRATKLISESPWNGTTVRMLFRDDGDLARSLDANAVDVVVVDRTATEYPQARDQLLAALRREPAKWSPSEVPGRFERKLSIYTRIERSGLMRNTVRIPMAYSLGHFVEAKVR